jgi:threonine aldolase
MVTTNRRRFLQLGGTATGLGLVPSIARGQVHGTPAAGEDPADRTVRLSGDGLGLTTSQYSRMLARLADESGIATDNYSMEGVVEELETAFARTLGKERAVFMPTGTLANHLAVRALAGGPSRVIVQDESHLYQDEGDCAQTLSGLTLVPLAPGRATFTAADVQAAIERTKGARVVRRVSVISIETPVRRRQGAMFDAAEMQQIIALAKREGIRLHLDGARLFLQAAYTGQSVSETAKPFDTVYISLYKYFNAASGAILAGPRALLDEMYHERRMFGGGLASVWPFAAIALHYKNGFEARYTQALRTSEAVIERLGQHGAFTIERIPAGTNLFRLRLKSGDAAAFRQRLAARSIMLSAPQGNTFLVGVNETMNRMPAAELADAFVRSLS